MHADHITGTGFLKQLLPGSKSVISRASGALADQYLEHSDIVDFGRHQIRALATPGHTSGCMTFILEEQARPRFQLFYVEAVWEQQPQWRRQAIGACAVPKISAISILLLFSIAWRLFLFAGPYGTAICCRLTPRTHALHYSWTNGFVLPAGNRIYWRHIVNPRLWTNGFPGGRLEDVIQERVRAYFQPSR